MPRFGCARDHRLQRLARARGVEQFELDAVLLEDAGLVAEMRDRGVPVAALADGHLDHVVGAKREARSEQRGRGERREPVAG